MLQMSKNRKTKRICFMGLLFATVVVLSYIEGMVSVPGLPPGVKLGLSNIVTMCVFSGCFQCIYISCAEGAFGTADARAYRSIAESAGRVDFCNGDAVAVASQRQQPFLFGYQHFRRNRP